MGKTVSQCQSDLYTNILNLKTLLSYFARDMAVHQIPQINMPKKKNSTVKKKKKTTLYESSYWQYILINNIPFFYLEK